MANRELPDWFGGLVGVTAALAGLWGLWCTVIAFVGGTMPLLGIQVDGSIVGGLLMLFIGEPILMTVSYWAAMLVLTPIGMIFSKRVA